MTAGSTRQELRALPKTIWAMGIVTLFMNMSSIIIFSLSPLYLTTVLGVSIAGVGMLEGIVESLAWFTRLFSGLISDYFHKRKPLLIISCGLMMVARPLFVIAHTLEWVFLSRSLDRIANGLQATPREALVGDAAPKNLKGSSFGLRQALSVGGSMLGALLVLGWSLQETRSYTHIFWIACIPPVIAFGILWACVKDYSPRAWGHKKESFKTVISRCTHLSAGYWRIVIIAFIFMVSNYSGAFLILRITEGTSDLGMAALAMIVQNLASMLFAYPAGRLSDHMDRRWILAVGFFLTILSNTCLGYATSFVGGMAGAALWGAQLGTVQSLFMAKITDHTHQDLRATAFGVYYVLIACSVLMGNKMMGYFYETYGPTYGFNASSVMVIIALLALPLVKGKQKSKHY